MRLYPVSAKFAVIPKARFGKQTEAVPKHTEKPFYGSRWNPHYPGKLYKTFDETPAGGLLQFIDAWKRMSQKPWQEPSFKLRLGKVQARYGLHIYDQDLVDRRMDPVSQVFSSPEMTLKIESLLRRDEIQKTLQYFLPKDQRLMLQQLLREPERLLQFAQNFTDSRFQSVVRAAAGPSHPFHRLFFEPRTGAEKLPLMNHFSGLYSLLGPGFRHQGGAPGITSPIALHRFPPFEGQMKDFLPLLANISNLDLKEQLLRMACSDDGENRILLNTVSRRFYQEGGRQILSFFKETDPSGRAESDCMSALLEYREFRSPQEKQQFRLTLARFLLLGAHWILPEPDVAPGQKRDDLQRLMSSLGKPDTFLTVWQKMNSRYPLFPSGTIQSSP